MFLTAYVLLGLRLNSSSKLKDKQCKQKISQQNEKVRKLKSKFSLTSGEL